ncbi:hypothetical protein N7449_008960 [Penicillium cf. viridicatum]|uniref:Uncharacterized protein n=1 Tax=Penicillium cf. viridicatum TaxID=2972119 RepID=A0A9W9M8K6_9EURO|nr:hypothetical protein N7449_008960 [Penicillium cf. viridicatum]
MGDDVDTCGCRSASLLLDDPVIAPQISLVALRGSLCKPIFAPLFRFRLLFLLPDSELSILGTISQELPPNLTSCPLAPITYFVVSQRD